MVRATINEHLKELQGDLLTMGSMVEKAIERSLEALKKRDLVVAKEVIADDAAINRKRFEIEEKGIELITTQQPVARDLRVIIVVLNIISEMERMADYAESIARIAINLGDEPPLKPLIDIPRMATKAVSMLRRSLTAFLEQDLTMAKQISAEDDEVDNLYDQIYRELLIFMLQDPKTITRATHLLWVAHDLESIADRVTSICERIIFLITGKYEDLSISKY